MELECKEKVSTIGEKMGKRIPNPLDLRVSLPLSQVMYDALRDWGSRNNGQSVVASIRALVAIGLRESAEDELRKKKARELTAEQIESMLRIVKEVS